MTMDFNSLTAGSPFYILKEGGEAPVLSIGTLKSKTTPAPKYQAQAVPPAFNGTNVQQFMSLTVNIDGKDETISDVPSNIEIAARGKDTFSGSREAMIQAVDSMIQTSRKSLERIDYHKMVLSEGEKMLELLNPRYAEEKQQAQTIKSLEQRQVETERKLSSLEEQNSEMLAILRKLNQPSSKK